MFKRIFRKQKEEKKEVLTLPELKLKIQKQIEEKNIDISNFIESKLDEFRTCIQNLRSGLEKFDPSVLHPRLKGVGSSFKSSTLKLWKKVNIENFDEIEKAVEKTAIMKVKHFRLLFGVNPPEIEPLNNELSRIAAIVKEVNEKKAETKIAELREVLREIKEVESRIEERDVLIKKIEKRRENAEETDSKKESETKLKELERKLQDVEKALQLKESEIQSIIAIARKPLRIYSHMTGQKRKDFDFRDESSAIIASKTASEIKKGNIKIKEKQVKTVLFSLKCISSGKIKKELEEIDELRSEANKIRDEILKVRMGSDGKNLIKKNIQKEVRIYEEKKRKLNEEIESRIRNLEKKVNDISGQKIELRI